ncbi:hypothetical protein CLAIMM_05662 [Cladophialophora immunda]|nr:hypothetical protein CLAIMM_05662 [Cladophialophora immunda]
MSDTAGTLKMSASSRYQNQVDANGIFKEGSELRRDYDSYKARGTESKKSRTAYDSKAKELDRAGELPKAKVVRKTSSSSTGPVSQPRILPTPNPRGTSESGVLQGRAFHSQDHDQLRVLANKAGWDANQEASERTGFNVEHKEFWTTVVGNNSLQRHETESSSRGQSANGMFEKSAIHRKYGTEPLPTPALRNPPLVLPQRYTPKPPPAPVRQRCLSGPSTAEETKAAEARWSGARWSEARRSEPGTAEETRPQKPVGQSSNGLYDHSHKG